MNGKKVSTRSCCAEVLVFFCFTHTCAPLCANSELQGYKYHTLFWKPNKFSSFFPTMNTLFHFTAIFSVVVSSYLSTPVLNGNKCWCECPCTDTASAQRKNLAGWGLNKIAQKCFFAHCFFFFWLNRAT